MLYFFLNLVFINLFLYYNNYIFLAFILITLVVISKRYNFKLFIIGCLSVILFFSFNMDYYDYSYADLDINNVFEVKEVKENYSIVSDGNREFLVFNNDNEFVRGNKILFKGRLVDIRDSYNSFNTYLNKKAINYEIDYYEYEVKDSNVRLNDVIIDKLLENKKEDTVSYLKLILFNVKDDYNSDFYNTFSMFSLTHLIAVSGFHINILLMFFKKIFKKDFFGYFGVAFYLFLLDFSVSSYRAFLCNIFKKLNKKLEFDLSNIDIISLIGIVFIVINPSNMFSYGFIFSFLSTFVLEIFKLYSKNKFLLTFYIYLVNIPLILISYYKLNMATLVFSVLLSPVVSFLYVFSFIYLFLDKFFLVYKLVFYLLSKVFSFLSNFNLILVFGKPSVIFIIMYYLFLLCFFIYKERGRNIRYLYMFFIMIILGIKYCNGYLNSNEQFYFLNVGQGDCTVFMVPNSKKAVLLDTGGNKYKDVATSEIIPFLESKGINEIEKVIISHDDFDHNGSLTSLMNNFKVNEVVSTSLIESISIGEKEFINLNVNSNRDNDGSLVLIGEYGGYKLLLMGDASSDIEMNIANKVEDVDIVKVGHHGSSSSSSELFLKKVGGEIAIISVGKNNIYGHPHQEVVDRLEKYGYFIFRTDLNNDIGFGKNIFGFSFIDYFN